MRIRIDPSAANDPDAFQWLDRVLHKIVDGWHVWDTINQADPDLMTKTKWIRDRGHHGKWVHSMLVASTQRAIWTLAPHGRLVSITASPTAPDELTPQDACRLAEEPLFILVENRFSDGAFVRRVIQELDEPLWALWNQPGGPVRIDSVGGKGQMIDEVKSRMQGQTFRPRLAAVIDSDRRGPDTQPITEARDLSRTCTRANLPCWILAKREAENYLPRILLNARPNVGAVYRRRVDAWNRLNSDQKNYIDMKCGIPDTPSEVENRLFDGLSQPDRASLSSGFGSKVHKCWTLSNVNAKQELLGRSEGDLEYGISLIRSGI